jgi:hypothetical protein
LFDDCSSSVVSHTSSVSSSSHRRIVCHQGDAASQARAGLALHSSHSLERQLQLSCCAPFCIHGESLRAASRAVLFRSD